MAEEVLVTVRVDRPKNQDELTKLTGQIIAQKKEVEFLQTAIKNLTKAEGDNTELIKSATKNLEIKKQQLNQNVASQKAMVNVINAEVKSLNALKAENVQLIRQRNQLNIETEEGRAGIARINAQLDVNNAKIRENSSGLEKQKINIGNYQSALQGISPALGNFVNTLTTATKAAYAFVATPLGATLAVIGLALAPLISFFKDTAVGADAAAREAQGFALVMDIVRDKVNKFGSEQADVFDALVDSFFALNPALNALRLQYNALAEAGRAYADQLDEIQDREAEFSVEVANTSNEIKRLILESKNRTKTEAERIALIDQALTLEAQLSVQRKANAADELSATVERNRERLKGIGLVQGELETQEQFAKRSISVIRESALSNGDALADLIIKNLKGLAEAEGESIAIEEKLQNQRDALLDKAEEKSLKRAEDAKKLREERAKEVEDASIEEYEFQKELQEKGQTERQEAREKELDEEAEYYRAQEKLNRENAKKRIEFETLVTQAKINLASQLGNFISILAGKNKALAIAGILIEKAASVAQIVANTAIANAKAVRDFYITGGMPFVAINTAAAALSIGSTVAQASKSISEINSAKFAKGGIITGRSHAHGGVPFRVKGSPVINEYEGGEAVINKESTRMFKPLLSRINVAGGGKAFATGGIMDNSVRVASSFAESRFDINQLANLVNKIQPILVLEQFEAKQAEVNGVKQMARVI